MNHPRELSTPSRCPNCTSTSWTSHTKEGITHWQCNKCRKWLDELALMDVVKNPRPSGYMKDPSMQQAADEISAVLRKHDLMGVVLIAGKERSGWNIELSPSWSCIRRGEPTEDGGAQIRIKSKLEDYASKEEQEQVLACSIGGIMGILHNTKYITESLGNLMGAVSHKVEIQHVQHDPNIKDVRIDMED